MEVKEKSIEKRKVIILDGEETIVFLADAHNNWKYIEEFAEEVKKHPEWKVIITGDLWDVEQYSVHPTAGAITSLQQGVTQMITVLEPIMEQIIAFIWGNHETRAFRFPSGKGTFPSYFDVFFQAWKMKNPNAVICELDRALILEVNSGEKTYRTLIKHGSRAGKNFGVLEFRDILAVNEDFDMIVLSHLHIPEYRVLRRAGEGNPQEIHMVRTTAPMDLPAYADKANLFISPGGITKVRYLKDGIKVELL